MTPRIERMLDALKSREYRKQRVLLNNVNVADYKELNRQVEIFKEMSELEKPIIFDGDSFGFNRYTNYIVPERAGNVTPNYGRVISDGFEKVISDIKANQKKTRNEEKRKYAQAMLALLQICIDISEKYRNYAEEIGNTRLYNALLNIPMYGAESFYEALVFMKIITYCLRLYGTSLLTLGRFDQYMYPFYLKDKAKGVNDDEIFELLEEFFISLNYDTDLYHGVQQGDNGQSVVLGGFDQNGNSMYNELSQMCMQASLELSVIDPKINLRVGKNTPDELYEYATLLTKQGLGFPQYCNDDVIVPGLIKLGYAPEDAVNYSVAACWECIIPGHGADIPNFNTMDFPSVINRAVVNNLKECNSFSELMDCVEAEIKEECQYLINDKKFDVFAPMPLLSVFMDGCIESLTDMWSNGTKYLNFGCHGTGIANAADALAAIKKNVYDNEILDKQVILDALSDDFENFPEVRNVLLNSPKMGNNDDFVDDIAKAIMEVFAENMNNADNFHGGIWRAGTGSAMEYLWKGEKCPATADGRKAWEAYSSSFSPSLTARTTGLLSVIQSFTKFDLTNIINGGPLTIELHDTVLRNDVGINKTAMLVKNYILLGGHQLQLNSVNKERLMDAQLHPELHNDLIVRVWGWSGYFNELDVKYQNHIIQRCEYGI